MQKLCLKSCPAEVWGESVQQVSQPREAKGEARAEDCKGAQLLGTVCFPLPLLDPGLSGWI